MSARVPPIDDTFGAGFIGALVTGVLYGITTLQTYFYYVYYPRDGGDIKSLVAIVWVLDTLHFGFVCHTMYHYLVTNYANPRALAFGHWALNASVLLNVVIGVLAQSFFTIRISRLCSPKYRRWITILIGILVIAHFCLGVETVVFLFIKKEFRRLPEMTLIAATPFAIAAVLSDVAIATALCVLLHGSRTGFRQTNTIVTKLIVYAINRCILTSAVAIVEVIVFALTPESLWFVAIDFVIGKLYANSLLATLNSRNAIREKGGSQATSVGLSNIGFSSRSGGTDDHVLNLSAGGSSADRTTSSASYYIGSKPPDIKEPDQVIA